MRHPGDMTKTLRHVRLATVLATAAVLTGALAACTPGADGGDGTATPTATPTVQAPALALSDLLAVDVPALCEHPAGTLVDGVLPGIPESEGRVMLGGTLAEDLLAGATASDEAVIGEDADGEAFLAAHVYCDRGGVRWPSRVVVWNAALEPVATFLPEELTGGDREWIAGVAAADDGIHVRWTAPGPNDPACCYQLSVEADIAVDTASGDLTPGEPVVHRGEEQLRAMAEAALAGEPEPDGIEIVEGLSEGVASVAEKGWEYDLDGITCRDNVNGDALDRPIICGIPVTMDGEQLAFVIYPTLTGGWNEYALTSFDYELW